MAKKAKATNLPADGTVIDMEHAPAGEILERWRSGGGRKRYVWRIVGQYGRIGEPTGRTCCDCGEPIREGQCAMVQTSRKMDQATAEDFDKITDPVSPKYPNGPDPVWHLACRPELLAGLEDHPMAAMSISKRYAALKLKGHREVTLVEAVESPGFLFDVSPFLLELGVDRARQRLAEAERRGAKEVEACRRKVKAWERDPLLVDGGEGLVRAKIAEGMRQAANGAAEAMAAA